MANKDWKLKKETDNESWFKKKLDQGRVRLLHISDTNIGWEVTVQLSYNTYPYMFCEDGIKNKAKAIAIAKSYMKVN